MRRLFTNRDRPSPISGPELRDPQRELLHFRRRLLIAGAMVIVAFGGLLGRFVYLQLFQHSHYQTLAESNRIAIVPIVPNRGVMTDRNGVVLAQSYSAYTLEVTPSRVKNLDETIDGLATIVEVQARDRKRFKRLLEESKNFESLPLEALAIPRLNLDDGGQLVDRLVEILDPRRRNFERIGGIALRQHDAVAVGHHAAVGNDRHDGDAVAFRKRLIMPMLE